MKLALIGATGNVGRRILDEALRRGHTVTAIARDPAKVQSLPGGTSFHRRRRASRGTRGGTQGPRRRHQQRSVPLKRSGQAHRRGAPLGREALSGRERRRQP
jgi:hypothetical protein